LADLVLLQKIIPEHEAPASQSGQISYQRVAPY